MPRIRINHLGSRIHDSIVDLCNECAENIEVGDDTEEAHLQTIGSTAVCPPGVVSAIDLGHESYMYDPDANCAACEVELTGLDD